MYVQAYESHILLLVQILKNKIKQKLLILRESNNGEPLADHWNNFMILPSLETKAKGQGDERVFYGP